MKRRVFGLLTFLRRVCMSAHPETIRIFRTFVQRSKALLQLTRETVPHERFKQFVVAARAVVVSELPRTLADLQPLLAAIGCWLLPADHDILQIARVTWDEDAYTNLLAWWLRPATHPATALRRQRAFLEMLGLREVSSVAATAEPLLRPFTDDGFPDLVMVFSGFAVVVEVKTGTLEHVTPSCTPQTISYPEAVRRKFAIPCSEPVHTAFLTIDRSAPANEVAIPLSFLDCALSIATQFQPSEFGRELGPLFRVWLTHLLIEATQPGVDVPGLVDQFQSAAAGGDLVFLPHLRTITQLHAASAGLFHA
jgi:hypothetical protein